MYKSASASLLEAWAELDRTEPDVSIEEIFGDLPSTIARLHRMGITTEQELVNRMSDLPERIQDLYGQWVVETYE